MGRLGSCVRVVGLRSRGWVLVVVAAAALWVAAPAMATGVTAWGEGQYGQLGNGSEKGSLVPVPVSGLGEVTAISAGTEFSMALINGTVMTWGENAFGELGDGNSGPERCGEPGPFAAYCSRIPVPVGELSGVSAISAGRYRGLALLEDGNVMAWGWSEAGLQGNGTQNGPELCTIPGGGAKAGCSTKPLQVSGLSEVKAVSAGFGFSLALLKDGKVMAWGENGDGELGDGTTTGPETCTGFEFFMAPCSDVPVEVAGLSEVTAISAGDKYALALLADGKVMAWGNGFEFHSAVPVEITGLSEVTAISTAGEHSLALLSNGKVMSWGRNEAGDLGDGTASTSSAVPVEVSELSGVTAISAAFDVSLALLSDHNVDAWGAGNGGKLGSGWEEFSTRPAGVCGLTRAGAISAGGPHALAYSPVSEASSPTITQLEPDAGPLAGGGTVMITGTNLGEATEVLFGSTSAASFRVISGSSIEAVSPSGQGIAHVRVITPGATSATCPAAPDKFAFVAPPAITKVKPKSGSAAGGATVKITGSNLETDVSLHAGSEPEKFGLASAVKFGSVDAASFKVVGPTTIEAVSPPQAPTRPEDITVVTPGGTSAVSSADLYKVTPMVTGVSPNTGSTAGGTSLTITGVGFGLGTKATVFKFGTAKATSVNCASATECSVVAPPHAAGIVDVKATTNKVSSPKNAPADQFTYE